MKGKKSLLCQFSTPTCFVCSTSPKSGLKNLCKLYLSSISPNPTSSGRVRRFLEEHLQVKSETFHMTITWKTPSHATFVNLSQSIQIGSTQPGNRTEAFPSVRLMQHRHCSKVTLDHLSDEFCCLFVQAAVRPSLDPRVSHRIARTPLAVLVPFR